jgi:RNA polymerase sigma-70 factor (ECF subfamily)
MPDESPQPVDPDAELVVQLRLGSETAAGRLYLRYAGRLRALAWARLSPDLSRRVDADDIVQSVFRRFFQAARDGNYDVPEGEDLWDLLLAITLNRLSSERSHQRAAKRDSRRTVGLSTGGGDPKLISRDDIAARLLRLTLVDSLARLPAEDRAIADLRMEGHEVAEIARLTGRPLRSVERVLQQVRRLLSDSLGAGE